MFSETVACTMYRFSNMESTCSSCEQELKQLCSWIEITELLASINAKITALGARFHNLSSQNKELRKNINNSSQRLQQLSHHGASPHSASYHSIGLMSGTSLDGIDIAYIITDGYTIDKCVAFDTYPYPTKFIHQMKSILGSTTRSVLITTLENQLTRYHHDAVQNFIKKYQIDWDLIDLVSFHGQTIYHQSLLDNNNSKIDDDNIIIDDSSGVNSDIDGVGNSNSNSNGGSSVVIGKNARTWQIGNGQMLANLLNKAVMYNLRKNDILYNGQGAPLAPIYHCCIANTLCNIKEKNSKEEKNDLKMRYQLPMIFVNIGGVSNVTYVFAKRDHDNVDENKEKKKKNNENKEDTHSEFECDMIAFDTGPGNCVLDDWIQDCYNYNHNINCNKSKNVSMAMPFAFDKDGMYSSKHKVSQNEIKSIVNKFLKHPYFTQIIPPKSLDRNELHSYLLSKDLLNINLSNLSNVSTPENNDTDHKNEDLITMEKVCDTAGILVECTVAAIIDQVIKYCVNDKDFLNTFPKCWFICGGGRHNQYIMSRLQQCINDTLGDFMSHDSGLETKNKQLGSKLSSIVVKVDELRKVDDKFNGIDGDAIEAQSWAYLGVRALKSLHVTVPTTTGVVKPVTGGDFCLPKRK